MMQTCRLCPRNCGADRENGKTGYCGEYAEVRVARVSLHMWEEPCISGTNGSGTIFSLAVRFDACSARTKASRLETRVKRSQ